MPPFTPRTRSNELHLMIIGLMGRNRFHMAMCQLPIRIHIIREQRLIKTLRLMASILMPRRLQLRRTILEQAHSIEPEGFNGSGLIKALILLL